MESKPNYGFIVGRFQVPRLHDGHRELINLVRSFHKRVVVFIGISPFQFTQSNPMDFITRKRMIEGQFPDVTCLPLYDCGSDKVWSEELDRQISRAANGAEVTLYGGRDSFVPHYYGKHKPVELKNLSGNISGTQVRADANSEVLDSEAFRQGVLYAVHNRYPHVSPTVDVAIIDSVHPDQVVLLVQKTGESGWRFPGGFIEPKDINAEHRVKLESNEETNLWVDGVTYIGSHSVDDWRLRNDTDSIMTIFFRAKYVSGAIKAGDDADSVKWFLIRSLTASDFVPEHRPLFELLQGRI